MACLKLDDLEKPLMEETILLEIKLATMLYYFKVCRYEHEYQVNNSMPYPSQFEIHLFFFQDNVQAITKMCN